ncbi:hypothetical protein [Nonomuraea maritima]|uniref:hypothetical protein n=1 Tax=Nonomuraea maritima TaxID=683260 RepID=UPI0037186633
MFIPEYERPDRKRGQRRHKRARLRLPITRVTDASGNTLCVIEGWGVDADDIAAARSLHHGGQPAGYDPGPHAA